MAGIEGRHKPAGSEDRADGRVAARCDRFLVVIGLAAFVILVLVFEIWRWEKMAPPGFR
jgi:hypothetical protein